MNKKLIVLFFFICISSFGQRIKIDKKELQFLKGETKVGVKFTFPEGFRMDGDHIPETDFLKIKEEAWNKKISPDGGKRWLEAYELSKKEDWLNTFITAFNETAEYYTDLKLTSDVSNTNYTIIVETNWMYMGYHGGVIYQRAKLKTTIRFVKTENLNEELYATETPVIRGFLGEGLFNDLSRVNQAYDQTSYLLALSLKKVLKRSRKKS
ncbi:hypothetical protein [uncultured Aquimarina sp.]|uniref:hypothetical protein n=1 Tax=uncultured Aquimarina sp. TaxID=575652 RepID=UPI00260E363E|nr:hypothetical protein [uncultured Aquimarina sp.]